MNRSCLATSRGGLSNVTECQRQIPPLHSLQKLPGLLHDMSLNQPCSTNSQRHGGSASQHTPAQACFVIVEYDPDVRIVGEWWQVVLDMISAALLDDGLDLSQL